MTDTPTLEIAAIKLFNAGRVAAGKPEVDGTPCLVHRAMMPFKIWDEQLAQDVPQWAALQHLPRIFNRSAVEYFLRDNGMQKAVIAVGGSTRWLGHLKTPRDVCKVAPGLDAFMEENPRHAATEAWGRLGFGSVQEFADIVGPYAKFAKDAWEEAIKLYQKHNAVGLASTVYSFDVALRKKLQDPKLDGVELPAALQAGRAAIAKMDELEGEHQRRPYDAAAALLHPVTHVAMLKKLEPKDLEAAKRYLAELVRRMPIAMRQDGVPPVESQIDTSDPMTMILTQAPMRSRRPPAARASLAPAQKSPEDEVREKLEALKSVVIDRAALPNFNIAKYWTARYRDSVEKGETGRFERAAVVLSVAAVGNPRIESVFSRAGYIIDDYLAADAPRDDQRVCRAGRERRPGNSGVAPGGRGVADRAADELPRGDLPSVAAPDRWHAGCVPEVQAARGRAAVRARSPRRRSRQAPDAVLGAGAA